MLCRRAIESEQGRSGQLRLVSLAGHTERPSPGPNNGWGNPFCLRSAGWLNIIINEIHRLYLLRQLRVALPRRRVGIDVCIWYVVPNGKWLHIMSKSNGMLVFKRRL